MCDGAGLANDLVVGTRSLTLAAGASQTFTTSWSTAGLASGSYAISALVGAVPGETDLADNVYTDGTVTLSTPPPVAPIMRLGRIWPEWRRAAAGTAQVLYAKVVNTGTVGAYAQVRYDVYDRPTGAKVATLSSQIVWVDAGAVLGDLAFASDPWTGDPGIYSVVATLIYGTDPTNLNLVDL